MSVISLRYGRGELPFEYDEGRFRVISAKNPQRSLSDVEINQKLDKPIESPLIEDIVSAGNSVLLVVPDATRQTASGQVVNLLVRRLIANGTQPSDINIIFATGIHRSVTSDEKLAILTPFIAQRIKTLDHDPRDLASIVRLGETERSIPIELNRSVTEFDHVILIGGVTFHYFAGFTGGRKLVCPGLCSSRTINATHKLAFDCEKRSRRTGIGPGLLDGNAVHEAFAEIVSAVKPAFAVNTMVNDAGDLVDLYCGHWKSSHRAACDEYSSKHTIEIDEKRELVIVSCGGFPHDINLIQAHKALEAASSACTDGGTIVLLAECPDGIGRADFLDWFDAENSTALAGRLCERYQVNGQTAWSLLQKAERFNVQIITSLDESGIKAMRLKKIQSLHGLPNVNAFILPEGAKYLVRERN